MEPLLLLGGAALAAPWWAHHRARAVDRPLAASDDMSVTGLWARHVAAPSHALPGASLTRLGAFEHGETYRVQLVPGRQSLAMAHSALPLICTGLRRPLDELVIERDPDTADPSLLRMQVLTTSPIKDTVLFDGPRFAEGRIMLGPYADGLGDATYRLYTRNSMWGGFLLGSIGSGKTRISESVALSARAMAPVMPTSVVYVDGQDGASSSVLWKHSALRGGSGDSGRVLEVIEAIMHTRQQYNVAHELAGFTPGADRVGILIIVDECHVPFGKHAERWAHIARTGRKVGVAVLAADQYSDLKVFGNMEPLRSSLLAGNGLVLRTTSRMAGHLLPGLNLDPYELPELPGYGYTIAAAGSDARTAPFRARYLPDRDDKADDPSIAVPSVQEWFDRIPAVQLDAEAQRAMDRALERLDRPARKTLSPSVPAVADDEELGGTMADRILALMSSHDGPMRLAEILAALPSETVVSTVQKAIKGLVDRGTVLRVEHGVYELPPG